MGYYAERQKGSFAGSYRHEERWDITIARATELAHMVLRDNTAKLHRL
jgi:hypothetical protein